MFVPARRFSTRVSNDLLHPPGGALPGKVSGSGESHRRFARSAIVRSNSGSILAAWPKSTNRPFPIRLSPGDALPAGPLFRPIESRQLVLGASRRWPLLHLCPTRRKVVLHSLDPAHCIAESSRLPVLVWPPDDQRQTRRPRTRQLGGSVHHRQSVV